jgi:hypothetical protein
VAADVTLEAELFRVNAASAAVSPDTRAAILAIVEAA